MHAMHSLDLPWLVCGVVWAGITFGGTFEGSAHAARGAAKKAPAGAPATAAATAAKDATALVANGQYPEALKLIDAALAAAPGDLALLKLKAQTLLEMRDFEAALAAYETFLAAGPKGANRRAAEKIVANLKSVRTTFLDLTVAGASAEKPATVYLDSKTLGVFCVAAPTCRRGVLPGQYRIIIERPGYQKLTDRVTVAADATFKLDKTLTESPSALAVRASLAGAGQSDAAATTVVLDGKELGAAPQSATVPAGDHTLEVRASGYATHRQAFAAHEGQPLDVAVVLQPLVAIAVNVEGAEVLLAGQEVAREQGALVLPEGAVQVTVRAKGFRTKTVDVPAARAVGFRLDVTLSPAPAPMTVAGAPSGAVVSVDGRLAGTVPLAKPIEVDQGAHSIEVSAPGRATYRTSVKIESDDPLELVVTKMPSTRRPKLWVASVTAGAALVSWGVFGGLALSRESDYADRAQMPGITPDDSKLVTLRDEGETFATVSDVSLVIAAASAGAATWFFLTEGKGESSGAITPIVGPGAVGVQGTF
jgi:hypothetical protein